MAFERIVEALIKEAMERGDFDNLPGRGKPVDLSEYFETPEDVRMANSVLKSAGMTSREVDQLKEIAELKQLLDAVVDEKQIQQKQVEFSLMMERQKKHTKGTSTGILLQKPCISPKTHISCIWNSALQIIPSLLYFRLLKLTFSAPFGGQFA